MEQLNLETIETRKIPICSWKPIADRGSLREDKIDPFNSCYSCDGTRYCEIGRNCSNFFEMPYEE